MVRLPGPAGAKAQGHFAGGFGTTQVVPVTKIRNQARPGEFILRSRADCESSRRLLEGVGFGDPNGHVADAPNHAHALGHTDRAARIEQIE